MADPIPSDAIPDPSPPLPSPASIAPESWSPEPTIAPASTNTAAATSHNTLHSDKEGVLQDDPVAEVLEEAAKQLGDTVPRPRASPASQTSQHQDSTTLAPKATGGKGVRPGTPSVHRADTSLLAENASMHGPSRIQTQDPERDAEPTVSGVRTRPGPKLRIVDVLLEANKATLALSIDDPLPDIAASFHQISQHLGGTARIFEYTPGSLYDPRNRHDESTHYPGAHDAVQDHLVRHMEITYGTIPCEVESMIRSPYDEDHDYHCYGNLSRLVTDVDAVCAQFEQSFDSPCIRRIRAPTVLRFLDDKSFPALGARNSSFCSLKASNDRLVIVIVNQNWGPRYVNPRRPSPNWIFFSKYLVDVILDGHTMWTSFDRAALGHHALLFVINFLFTCIYLEDANSVGLTVQHLPFDTRERSPLGYMLMSRNQTPNWLSKLPDGEMLGFLQQCESITRYVQDTAGAVLFLLKVLDLWTVSGPPSASSSRSSDQIPLEILKMREACAQRTQNCEKKVEQMYRTIDTQNKLLSIRESTSVKRLTILAALFLPASLASSILSMSIRFRDLGPLLYDWLGVLVLISSAAIILYFLVRAILHLKSNIDRIRWSPRARWGHGISSGFWGYWHRSAAAVQLATYLALWGVISACFLLGMFRDFNLGGRVLGYGLAGIFGWIVLVGLLALGLLLLNSRNLRRQNQV